MFTEEELLEGKRLTELYDLAVCPWCKQKPVIRYRKYAPGDMKPYSVECNTLNCPVVCYVEGNDVDDVVNTWNTCSARPAVQDNQEYEELEL